MLLEFKTEGSNKFWEPRLEMNIIEVRFGKIGTDGQSHEKRFPLHAEALTEYRRLVCEKLAQGYKPTTDTVVELLNNAPPVEEPQAIASLYIGEHVPEEIIKDICGWATACLQHKMTPKQFKNVWQKFLEGEDEELEEALGRYSGEIADGESEFWLDNTVWEEGDLDELYAQAVENDGDRFIWFNNNAYIDIVALRGDPGARAIEVCVLGEENCKDEKGQWFTDWPKEFGPGAPIAWMSGDEVTLRDGKYWNTFD